jgi:hypothetical protein
MSNFNPNTVIPQLLFSAIYSQQPTSSFLTVFPSQGYCLQPILRLGFFSPILTAWTFLSVISAFSFWVLLEDPSRVTITVILGKVGVLTIFLKVLSKFPV